MGLQLIRELLSKHFRKYFDNSMKIILDNFTMYSDMESHL
jgi:hypothetical protein